MNRVLLNDNWASGGASKAVTAEGCTAVVLNIGAGTGSVTVKVTSTPHIPGSWRELVTLTGPGYVVKPIYHTHVKVEGAGAADWVLTGGVYVMTTPGTRAVPITPSDSATIDPAIEYLIAYSTTANQVANIEDASGTQVVWPCPPGIPVTISGVKKVLATGTTATVFGMRR